MEISKALIEIVGEGNSSEDLKIRESSIRHCGIGRSSLPNYIVQPKDKEEIQKILRLANETHVPVIPMSSGIHFNGASHAPQGGIALDLRRMNKILNIDERNRIVRFEPGVTWSQLQNELQKYDLMALNPLMPHPLKSALTSMLEREPMLVPKFEYGDPIFTLEEIFPTGELFRTGSACVTGFPDSAADGVNAQGPGIDWVRLVQGAQGTMGIVTWLNVKTEYKSKVNKTLFIPFEDLKDAVEPIYRIQFSMIGQECLLLNNFNLAAILADNWAKDFPEFKGKLSPWTLVLVLAGGKRRPEERIDYEEDALGKIISELSIPKFLNSISGYPGIEEKVPEILRNASPEEKTYWKFGHKGSCQDIYFHTVINRIPEFTNVIYEVAKKYDYPEDEIGFYIQPLERARACHYECNFYYDPADTEAVNTISSLVIELTEILVDMGAFFTRPYGPASDIVYDRATSYASALKKVKKLLDPNDILSPGRLCF